jgi:hypothetical protein
MALLSFSLVVVWEAPAKAAVAPTPKFRTPVCVSGFGVSLSGTVNWHSGPLGSVTINWGDGTIEPLPTLSGWHVYSTAGARTLMLTATSTKGSGSASTTVTVGPASATCLYKISPQPLAATGNLKPSQVVNVTVTVTTAKGALITTKEPVWLSATQAPGGGSASACCSAGQGTPQALTTTPVGFMTGIGEPSGTVVATYTAPSSVPTVGTDTITVANIPTSAATGTATTSYTFAPSVLPIAPPPAIPADCSTDVSGTLGPWLRNLPSDITVVPPPGSCYRVDEGLKLNFPMQLTIDGGTYENLATTPPPANGHALQRGFPVFNVLGGSDVTFHNLAISGADPTGSYLAKMAFAGGIELQGTTNATIDDVSITSVFGDGITLAPLRGGPNHNSGTIVSPVTNVTATGITVNGAGRMGVAFGSVNGSAMTNLSISNVGLDTFDVEADQSNEGAQNVTIDGCTASSAATSNFARTFFSNGGAGSAARTGNITVENCTMTEPQGTAALQLLRPGTGAVARGPFLFKNDTFACGQSTSITLVACVAVSGSNVTVLDSTFTFPSTPPIEAVYTVTTYSSVTFNNVTVTGYGNLGTVDATSTVTVNGGTWTPAG